MSRTFFTDRDLGNSFPERLRDAGIRVEKHADHFRHDADDADWLPQVGSNGWFVLTHDQRMRYRPAERDAIMMANVGLLVLIGKATHAELAENFVRTLDVVTRFIDRTPRPFIAKIYRPSPVGSQQPGRVELRFPARPGR